ncbi:RES domain-containing protein [Pistricoccus aurantiacus]|uniref:RES domain-containing protein n=1 Tax=Pistricoccus aurantiacus TaxID=1883414 RepID=A0A5B8SSG2_9GAMM|nr:RES family NAD+ phosphorylase [Pistricoccus aurantiacus]QEA39626.1 RES domain-containing protein [Pistricoccus aurantiacus]
MPQWKHAFRIVNSAFPPIEIFEDTLDLEDLEYAFALEALTNDRLLEQAGRLSRIPPADRMTGPGTSPIMAAFTHVGRPSRFTDGSYGVYYCASTLDTAIAETRYHMNAFLTATGESTLELTMRCYVNTIIQPLHDIRDAYPQLHDPDPGTYPICQAFAAELRSRQSWGLLHDSVRELGQECAAVFRPPALSIPVQGPHLRYFWDGKAQAITHVMEISEREGR